MAAVNCWMSCVKSLALTNKLLRSVVESLLSALKNWKYSYVVIKNVCLQYKYISM